MASGVKGDKRGKPAALLWFTGGRNGCLNIIMSIELFCLVNQFYTQLLKKLAKLSWWRQDKQSEDVSLSLAFPSCKALSCFTESEGYLHKI